MILCLKPSSFPMSPSLHRRHPSAPSAVVVHPTCTPGLLSVSKPPRPPTHRPQPHHQQRQPRTPRNKPAAHPRTRPPQAALALDPAKPSIEQAPKKTLPPLMVTPVSSPDRNPRGRTQSRPQKPKLNRRTASHSSMNGQGRRILNRQPSPQDQSFSSQAEGSSPIRPTHLHSQSLSLRNNLKHNNLFDPFVVSSSSDTDSGSDNIQSKRITPFDPVPKLILPSSGKSTHPRQPVPAFADSPTPASRTIPVPRNNNSRSLDNISRSDPVPSHMLPRPAYKRALVVEWDSFPVCDDLTIDEALPSTPAHPRHVATKDESTSDSAPRSAPLSVSSQFPISGLPSPTHTPPRSRHRRFPSDGVFNMSLDEYSITANSDDLNALLGPISKKRSPARVNKDKAGYFASSMFQNSPSPDELPQPSFGRLV